ncbi:MAG: HD domain-containing protein [Anaerolineaceae bacterium]
MTLDIETARQWYSQTDTVHGFDHILRVYKLAERIARAEGADLEIVRAAVLLHDSKGATVEQSTDNRKEHHIASAEFAEEVLQAEGWSPDRIAAVQHAIRAHRFRHNGERPETLEAQCLFDADKLDVIGAIGAARTIAYSTQAGQPLWSEPSKQFLSSGEKEPGEPHSPYHEYLFKLRRIKDQLFTSTGRERAVKRMAFLDSFFEQLAAEARGER